uniref:Uncharacterized protein n=1 Tax=Manihot esculenta TaxID=3983 RepID=A0A199UBK3_MANES
MFQNLKFNEVLLQSEMLANLASSRQLSAKCSRITSCIFKSS